MSRAAFVMDKLMTRLGLSGKSFLPLMSSYACAIPGIMATRVIENWRDRMVTILIAPLMSCSARLPVYILLTRAFVPDLSWGGGLISLQAIPSGHARRRLGSCGASGLDLEEVLLSWSDTCVCYGVTNVQVALGECPSRIEFGNAVRRL